MHDFLPRILPDGMLGEMLGPDERGFNSVRIRFFRPKRQPFMPVEFSAAAYRYGHSQVRGGYTINNTVPLRPTFVPDSELPPVEQQFERRRADFRGFTRLGLPPNGRSTGPSSSSSTARHRSRA